jgi:hypothetical protein
VQAKEKPILFSGAMVRAILDGRKIQTRRVITPKPDFIAGKHIWRDCDIEKSLAWVAAQSKYGPVGTRLWVRETWHGSWNKERALNPVHIMDTLCYRADFGDDDKGLQWRPSIHMPRWASRITLEVTGVRVERLKDISEADAKAEGVIPKMDTHIAANIAKDTPHRMEFWALWKSLNAKRGFGWSVNPWVWVVEFWRIP